MSRKRNEYLAVERLFQNPKNLNEYIEVNSYYDKNLIDGPQVLRYRQYVIDSDGIKTYKGTKADEWRVTNPAEAIELTSTFEGQRWNLIEANHYNKDGEKVDQ